jgi:hypothetical protein
MLHLFLPEREGKSPSERPLLARRPWKEGPDKSPAKQTLGACRTLTLTTHYAISRSNDSQHRRHPLCIKHWTKLMALMKNGVQSTRIILSQGVPKTPLPIMPKGPDISMFILNRSSCGMRPTISIIVGQSEEERAYS